MPVPYGLFLPAAQHSKRWPRPPQLCAPGHDPVTHRLLLQGVWHWEWHTSKGKQYEKILTAKRCPILCLHLYLYKHIQAPNTDTLFVSDLHTFILLQQSCDSTDYTTDDYCIYIMSSLCCAVGVYLSQRWSLMGATQPPPTLTDEEPPKRAPTAALSQSLLSRPCPTRHRFGFAGRGIRARIPLETPGKPCGIFGCP